MHSHPQSMPGFQDLCPASGLDLCMLVPVSAYLFMLGSMRVSTFKAVHYTHTGMPTGRYVMLLQSRVIEVSGVGFCSILSMCMEMVKNDPRVVCIYLYFFHVSMYK